MNLEQLCGYENKQSFEDEINSMYSMNSSNEVNDFLSKQGFLYNQEDLNDILSNNKEGMKERVSRDWKNIKEQQLRDYRNELKKKNLNKKKMKFLINKKKKELAKF